MSKWLRRYFIFLSIGTALVMAVPGLAILGFFMGVIPGLILALCPTALLYSTMWFVLRGLLLVLSDAVGFNTDLLRLRVPLGMVAASMVAAIVIVVPREFNESTTRAVSALRAGDYAPTELVMLPHNVALSFPETWNSRNHGACDTVCLRLLYNRSVAKVTARDRSRSRRSSEVGLDSWRSFRIERRDQCPDPGIAPHADVVFEADHAHRKAECEATAPNRACDYRLSGALERVRARIAAGDCLIQEPAGPFEPELVISFEEVKRRKSGSHDDTWSFTTDTVEAKRLEIRDPEGQMLFRRTEVVSEPLTVPLMIGAQGGFLTSYERRGLIRGTRKEGNLGPSARDILPLWLGEAVRLPDLPDDMR